MFVCINLGELDRMLRNPIRNYQYADALNKAAREVYLDVGRINFRDEIVRKYILPSMIRARDFIAQGARKSRERFLEAMDMRVSNLTERIVA